MPKATIGIYLDPEHLDLVALGGSFRRPHLLHYGRLPLPADVAWRHLVRAEEEPPPADEAAAAAKRLQAQEPVIRSLRELIGQVKFPIERAHIGVASESVVIRYFQMPTVPSHERKTAVGFEAKKYLPFKIEELITDFKTVISRSDPNATRVMFFGIKKDSLASYLSLLESAKLKPLSLEPAPLSLLRVLRQTGQLPPGQVTAILMVEQDTATITIARDDLLYVSRNVTVLPEPDEDLTAQLYEALLNETRVSIDYYRRRFLGEPAVDKVILFGEAADLKQTEGLAATLDLPVETGEPFRKTEGNETSNNPLAVALGLALRGLERKGLEANLLPPEQRRQVQSLVRPLAFQSGLAAAVLLIWLGTTSTGLNRWQHEIDQVRAAQVQPNQTPPSASLQELLAVRQNAEEEKQFIQSFMEEAQQPSGLLAQVARLIPSEAWLHSARLEGRPAHEKEPNDPSGKFPKRYARFMQLSGGVYAQNRDRELEQTNAFLAALQEDPLLRKIFFDFSLDSAQRGLFREEEVTQFKMTLQTGDDAQNRQRRYNP